MTEHESGLTGERGPLTRRQYEILGHLAQGLKHREIGLIPGLTSKAIEWHAQALKAKLGCKTTTQAILKAVALGILFTRVVTAPTQEES